MPAGASLAPANVLDVAPTILRLLDVELPGDLDGRPVEGLLAPYNPVGEAATTS
jgi:arylsulfatase A-like enzyme